MTGRAGTLLRAARRCTAAGALGARRCWAAQPQRRRCVSGLLVARRRRDRFGIFEAGVASARDPKYMVMPQRERLAARGAGVCSVAPDCCP